jgi:hypothetical protein
MAGSGFHQRSRMTVLLCTQSQTEKAASNAFFIFKKLLAAH